MSDEVLAWLFVCSEVDFLHTAQLMPLPSKNLTIFASFKSKLVLSFRYRLTQVVLEEAVKRL